VQSWSIHSIWEMGNGYSIWYLIPFQLITPSPN
jgi:hypothetical protein